MFSPVLADDAKAFFKDRVMGKFKYLDGELAGRDYLMGKQFTVADGYLFTMLCLGRPHEVRPLRDAEPARLQGPRRRAPEGAAGADQGRPDEGGVSFLPIATDGRAGSLIRPFFGGYSIVVPAKAGTDNHGSSLVNRDIAPACP